MIDEYDEQALKLRNTIKLNQSLRAEVDRLEAALGLARAQISDLQTQLTHAQAERRP